MCVKESLFHIDWPAVILCISCPTVKRSPAWEGCLRTLNKLVLDDIVCLSALSSHPRARYKYTVCIYLFISIENGIT